MDQLSLSLGMYGVPSVMDSTSLALVGVGVQHQVDLSFCTIGSQTYDDDARFLILVSIVLATILHALGNRI